MKADVIVLGSGGAGLSAALSAGLGGADVLVLERAPVFGGTTAISGGGMWMPNNPFEVVAEAKDSPEEVMTYLRAMTKGLVDERLLATFVEQAPRAVEFLQKETAIQLLPTYSSDYQSQLPGGRTIQPGPPDAPNIPGRSIAVGLFEGARLGDLQAKLRKPSEHGGMWPALENEFASSATLDVMYRASDVIKERREKGILARGAALVSVLLEAALCKGARLELGCRARHLLRDGSGRVTGVIVERDGKQETVTASVGVVLATGGIEWNQALWRSAIATPLDGPLTPPSNEGDGYVMAAELGARMANFREFGVWWMPAIRIPGETYDGKPRLRSATGAGGAAGAIAVNRRGRRFGSELMNYNDMGKLMTDFDPHSYEFVNYPAWVVFDRERRKEPLVSYEYDPESLVSDSWLTEAPTLRKLAEGIGVDPLGLEEEVREFNRHAERGEDPVFGRGSRNGWESTQKPRPLEPSGPYYAYRWSVGCYGTKCGPVINQHAQVIDNQGHPIPGLYASGNAAAGVFGPAYPGRGGTLAPAVTFGYVGGRHMTSQG
jgi:3-oxosteroid 1-dehydrogenase